MSRQTACDNCQATTPNPDIRAASQEPWIRVNNLDACSFACARALIGGLARKHTDAQQRFEEMERTSAEILKSAGYVAS